MSQAPSEVYARQLLPKKYGYPLFIPSPHNNLPREYRDRGVSIGDVGIIKPNGSFSFVFSICAPVTSPINCFGVPEGFQPVALGPEGIEVVEDRHNVGSDVVSTSVSRKDISVEVAVEENELLHIPAGVSAGYCLSSSSSEGAILTLPEGATSLDLYNIAEFRRYAINNAISWYQFVNVGLGREASNGSLYLVTGCDKSTTWGVASISCASGTGALSLKFTAAQLLDAGATREYSWETYCPATVRIGPKLCGDNEHPHNQCVFLRGFKIMLQAGLMAKMRGTVKVTSVLDAEGDRIISTHEKGRSIPFSGHRMGVSLPSGSTSYGRPGQQQSHAPDEYILESDSDEDVVLENFPAVAEAYHPSDVVNKYIIRANPDAQVAVTHESDWWTFFDDTVISDEDLIFRIQDEKISTASYGNGVFVDVPAHTAEDDDVWSMNSIDAGFSGFNSDDPMISAYERQGISGTMAVQCDQDTVSALIAPASRMRQHDAPSPIAFKSYNPSNFDTRPPFARFFVIKSFTQEHIRLSLKHEIWSSTDFGNKRLDKAFKECAGRGPIYLFFSVIASGNFCGIAEMLTPVDHTRRSTVWTSDRWKGVFKVRWIFIRDIPNTDLRHIKLKNTRERIPVTHSRDTQELLPEAGQEMLRIFSSHPATTFLLQDLAFFMPQETQVQSGAVSSDGSVPPIESLQPHEQLDSLIPIQQGVTKHHPKLSVGLSGPSAYPSEDEVLVCMDESYDLPMLD